VTTILRTIATRLANEPVVHIAGTVQAGAVWLFTYVATGWNPNAHQQQLAGIATAAAYAVSFIARQFVTPVTKAAPPAAPVPPAQ
jgi:hypothetical protein